MRGISHLELMPEPEDPSLLTAVDTDAPGYPGKAYGLTDQEARKLRWPMGPIINFLWPWGAVGFSAIVVSVMLVYPSISVSYTHLRAHETKTDLVCQSPRRPIPSLEHFQVQNILKGRLA